MEEAKATSAFPVRLDVIGEKGDILHTAEFIKEKIVLGRILSADLRIDDPRVSRIHALLEVRGENILITDLASTHGTFVNGERIVEAKIKVGDTIKLGHVDVKIQKGSGKVTSVTPPAQRPVFDSEETQIDIDRSLLDQTDRRSETDRRKKDAFPEEKRLEDRRQGERRLDEREEERRKKEEGVPAGVEDDRRSGEERREDRDWERRIGERRRGDRRLFDITSLERRIEERRIRKGDDDILPEELEKAFASPDHGRELEVTVLWGDHILDVSNYVDPVTLNVGENPKNQYIIPSVGIPDEFPLVTVEEDGNAHLAFTESMTGTVRARDKIYTLKELKDEKFVRKLGTSFILALKQDDFAKLSIGTVNFFVLYVKPAPRILPAPVFERDALLMRTFIGSAIFMLLMFIGIAFVPQPKPVTIEMIPERFAEIIIKKRPTLPKSGIIVKDHGPVDGGSKMGEGGRPAGPEGKLGKPELPEKKEVPQAILPKSSPKEKPNLAAQQRQRKLIDQQKAKSVGLLKAFGEAGVQKDLKALIDQGEGPPGQGGFDAFGKAVSGLRGNTIEEVGGAGGKGLKGVDVGGGGKTIGIDGPSTKGLGRGYEGTGIGEGISGPGRLGMKGEAAVSIISENVQVLSGLPKDVINAVVQRHRAEIRQCYEASRQKNPGLRGKVVAAFTIQPNGIVSYAGVKESTVGDPGLDNCIISRIRTWQFPKPEAPGVTEVTAFPFYLNPAN
ncbi:MAG: AgmX/PglI C-terminal domain-containing protein [Deltaproteobacteria bacterium]|nr:AgmX/PglI C-terminal domain-containing protein [Deltaproteobacteria bacterium]